MPAGIRIASAGGMGWKPELPSIKDFRFSMSPLADTSLPPETSDRRALNQNGPVIDQGAIGSCVGCSSTYGVAYLRRTDRDNLSTAYSALQLYYDARVEDGEQWAKIDAGAYIRDAMDTLRLKGVAPASKWPYKPAKFAVKPTASVYKAAASWKLGAHWKCDTLQDMLRAIASGCALVGGLAWYNSMSTPAVSQSGRLPIPKPQDTLEGGHALYFDRYNMSERLVRFQNSWGADWGDGGYGYVPFEFLSNQSLADDFWAMQAEAPETTPWKD